MTDPKILGVMVDASGRVFFQRVGTIAPFVATAFEERHILSPVSNIARSLRKDISEASPLFNCRLLNRSRIAVVIPPTIERILLTTESYGTNGVLREIILRSRRRLGAAA
jgi:type IV secretory pathway ATPase VirB11/archaellum biosynthesis ATPase